MRHKQAGFTLIEIAIVLVIIGLLLGGVLKGQELITQAKIKNVINDFNGVQAAVYGYQDRYKVLPGLDPNAATRWPTATWPGTLPTAFDGGLFWQELRLAGFLNGTPNTTPPTNAAGGNVTAIWVTGTSGSTLLGFQTPGIAICSDGLSGKIAESVDVQLDDGQLINGKIKGVLGSSITATTPAPASGTYVDSAANLYVICEAL